VTFYAWGAVSVLETWRNVRSGKRAYRLVNLRSRDY